MSAEAYRDEEIYREAGPDVISVRRNPYLVDYEQQRRLRDHGNQRISQSQREQVVQSFPQRTQRTPQRIQENTWGQELGRASRSMSRRDPVNQGEQELRRASRSMSRRNPVNQGEQELRRAPRSMSRRDPVNQGEQELRRVSQGAPLRRNIDTGNRDQSPGGTLLQTQKKRAAIEKKRAALQRRRIMRMQRMVLFAGVFGIALLCGILCMKRIDGKTEAPDDKSVQTKVAADSLPAVPSGIVQGLPAEEFAKHPDWEENLLTPNEYSRPGDALEEVNSIFVHYTANPNTSAAQNRSYFEQLKDTHITSASAHFIIGYNGEIVQCIPLDEIAYAVQTRNFDSVSIECCYKASDGSFTQETYDSLIDLLAWLTEAYDLTTEDILRHYDCGGKKCPIYYTEHEDAWAKLKKDVENKL